MSVFDYPRINFTGTITLDHANTSLIRAKVVGVQAGPDTLHTEADDRVPLSQLVGRELELSGNVIPINPEGSAPGAQFFVHELSWCHDSYFEVSGTPSKASAQWLDRTRNVNLAGDAGAGVYVHHVIEAARGGCVRIPGVDEGELAGAVLRYCMFARHGSTGEARELEARFSITGSLAPLRHGEAICSGPVGRLLTQDTPNIPTPPGTANNAQTPATRGKLALAPAVASWAGDRLSVDFLASFPEHFRGSDESQWDGRDPAALNPKFDFGPVALILRHGREEIALGPVDYTDLAAGDRRGWVFDFDLSEAARRALASDGASLELVSADYGVVLSEVEYQIATSALGIYAEQHGSRERFVGQGYPPEPVELRVYRRGRELAAADCPAIAVDSYQARPLAEPDERERITDDFGPGRALEIDVDRAGNRVLVFSVGDEEPPASYAELVDPASMALTNRASLSLRVLANEDLSAYWEDGQSGPVARDELSFEVLRGHVLNDYDSLTPAMDRELSLEDPGAVACYARELLTLSDPRAWSGPDYTPRARDLSASKRTLLQAWCRRVLRDAGASRAVSVYTVEFDRVEGHDAEAGGGLSAQALGCQGWRASGRREGARLRNMTEVTIRAVHLSCDNAARRFEIDGRSCGRLFGEVWTKLDGSEAVFLGAELRAGEELWVRVPANDPYEVRCCDGYGRCPFSLQVFADEGEARARFGDGAGWVRHHWFR